MVRVVVGLGACCGCVPSGGKLLRSFSTGRWRSGSGSLQSACASCIGMQHDIATQQMEWRIWCGTWYRVQYAHFG